MTLSSLVASPPSSISETALRPAPRRSLPLIAGVTYVLAWIVGLLVHTGPPHGATDADVLASAQAAGGAAIVGSLLVHGLAAAAFLAVALSLAGTAARRGRRRAAHVVTVAAAVATISSAAQVAVGVGSANVTTETAAGRLFDLLNLLDGAKLLAMAAVVGTGAFLSRRHELPRWHGAIGVLLAATLSLAGVGFLAAVTPLTVMAAPALLMLFVWVPATARAASR